MNPLISVILPVFNSEIFVEQAIQSILDQSYSNFELIIINDGSTDDSEKKILKFKDARIRYFKNEQNIGLVKTLNQAIQKSLGDYVARMDADDIAMQSRLEKQVQFLISNPDISLVGSAVNVIDQSNAIIDLWRYPTEPIQVKQAIYKSCCFAHPSVMFLKHRILEAGLYNETYKTNEDYELWIRFLKLNQAANLKDILLQYRVHSNQMSSNNVLKQTYICALIQREKIVDFNEDLKKQIVEAGFETKEINVMLINAFAFWIDLYLKMKNLDAADMLFEDLQKNLEQTNRGCQKALNAISIRIKVEKREIFAALVLVFKRIHLLLLKN